MKIVMAIKSLSEVGGGAERVLSIISSELAKKKYQVTIVCFDKKEQQPYFNIDSNVNVISIDTGQNEETTSPLIFIKKIVQLRRVIKLEKPDIVIGFMHSMFIPVTIALVGINIPVIASEHTVFKHYSKRILEKTLLLITFKFVDCITVVSDQVKQAYPEWLQGKMIVVNNPLDEKALKVKNKKSNNNRKVILAVGSLTPIKDHNTLIEAYALICNDYPEWDLRIIGEGELKKELQDRINLLGLSERVSLPGHKRDISEEYNNADMYVITSLYESFSLATAEALIHRLPSIGFDDCMGVNTLIQHEINGILVDSKDKKSNLAQGIKKLISNNDLRERMSIDNNSILHEFNTEKIVDDWVNLINHLVNRKQLLHSS